MARSSLILAAFLLPALLFTGSAAAQAKMPVKWQPGHYMRFLPTHPESQMNTFLNNTYTKGLCIQIKWKDLETAENVYNFSLVDKYLNMVKAKNKYLILKIEDRCFNGCTDAEAPAYLRTDPAYHGGVETMYKGPAPKGTVVRLWDQAVTDRFIALYQKLGERYDLDPNLAGVTIGNGESAIAINKSTAPGYSAANYERELVRMAREVHNAMPHTVSLTGMNFIEGGQNTFRRIAQNLTAFGSSGIHHPDTCPNNPDSDGYVIEREFQDELAISPSMQQACFVSPDSPTEEELYQFAVNNLHVNTIIWNQYRDGVTNYITSRVLPVVTNHSGYTVPDCPTSYLACVSNPNQTSCGDHSCNGAENCSSCPADCPCASGICCSGSCITPVCTQASQCGSDPCRTYTCSSPGTCAAACSSIPKTACQSGDSCCPPGCTSQTDSDCVPITQPDLCSGLTRLYRLDGSASDSSGLGKNGTVYGASPATGRFGQAYHFSGASDHISLPDPGMTGSSFTLSAWLLPESPPPSAQIFFSSHYNSSYQQSLHLRLYSDGRLLLGYYADDLNTSGGSVPFGRWSLVTFSYDSASDASRIYVNGTQAASGSQGPFSADPSASGIGRWAGPNKQYFNGTMDEVAVWNRSLSSQEIQSLYQRTQPLYCLPQDFHRSDTQSPYGCIQNPELFSFISLWHQDSTAYPMRELIEGIGKWKAGAGCP